MLKEILNARYSLRYSLARPKEEKKLHLLWNKNKSATYVKSITIKDAIET